MPENGSRKPKLEVSDAFWYIRSTQEINAKPSGFNIHHVHSSLHEQILGLLPALTGPIHQKNLETSTFLDFIWTADMEFSVLMA